MYPGAKWRLPIFGALLAAAAIDLWAERGVGQTTAGKQPVFVVVHGISGFYKQANSPAKPRSPGWSDGFAKACGLVDPTSGKSLVEEITFDDPYPDYSPEWAKHVQDDLVRIMTQAKRDGRPVVIISHSWGSVMTKIALEGGEISSDFDEDYYDGSFKTRPRHLAAKLAPLSPDLVAAEWLSIGSPLGKSEEGNATTPDKRALEKITYTLRRPSRVKHWTNIFDWNDTVSLQADTLPLPRDGGPDVNSGVGGPRVTNLIDRTKMASLTNVHETLWTRPEVVQWIRTVSSELAQGRSITEVRPLPEYRAVALPVPSATKTVVQNPPTTKGTSQGKPVPTTASIHTGQPGHVSDHKTKKQLRDEETKKLQERAKELAEKGGRLPEKTPEEKTAEGRPVVPQDCSVELVTWTTERTDARMTTTYDVRGGQVTCTVPDRVFSGSESDSSKYGGYRTSFTFTGELHDNTIVGEWLHRYTPQEVWRWDDKHVLLQHYRILRDLKAPTRIVLNLDGTATWSMQRSYLERYEIVFGPPSPDYSYSQEDTGGGAWHFRK
jgi:hypothetical protein